MPNTFVTDVRLMRPEMEAHPLVGRRRGEQEALGGEAYPLGENTHANNKDERARQSTGQSLMYAVVILLGLILVLTVARHWLRIRPAGAIDYPVAVIAATAFTLALLVSAARGGSTAQSGGLRERLALTFCPTIVVDAQTGRIVTANDAAEEIFGPARVLAGALFSELLTSDAPERCREKIVTEALRDGQAEVDACAVHTRCGGVRVVHIKARGLEDADGQLVAVAFLATEASKAVSDFASLQERLMSNISHELRTPLNVVMGFSELLTSGTLGELADNQLDAAQEIHVGGERILHLVNDILDIGRVRSYHLPSEERVVDVAEMIDRMERLLIGQARREEVEMRVRIDGQLPPMQVRERPFKQVLYHLMLHSIERSGPGDTVMITAEADALLTITVTDSGPVLAEGEIVAESLPELDDERASEELGPPMLGLPLCAALAASFGGRIIARSDAQGSHFALEVPVGHASLR